MISLFFLTFSLISGIQATRWLETLREGYYSPRELAATQAAGDKRLLQDEAIALFKSVDCYEDLIERLIQSPRSLIKKGNHIERIRNYQKFINIVYPYRGLFDREKASPIANCNFSDEEFEKFKKMVVNDPFLVGNLVCGKDAVTPGVELKVFMSRRRQMFIDILEFYKRFDLGTLAINVKNMVADRGLTDAILSFASGSNVTSLSFNFKLIIHSGIDHDPDFSTNFISSFKRLRLLSRYDFWPTNEEGFLNVNSCNVKATDLLYLPHLKGVCFYVTPSYINDALLFLTQSNLLQSIAFLLDDSSAIQKSQSSTISEAVLKHKSTLDSFKMAQADKNPELTNEWANVFNDIIRHARKITDLELKAIPPPNTSSYIHDYCQGVTYLRMLYSPASYKLYNFKALNGVKTLRLDIGTYPSKQVQKILTNLFRSLPPNMDNFQIKLEVINDSRGIIFHQWSPWHSLPKFLLKTVGKYMKEVSTFNGVPVEKWLNNDSAESRRKSKALLESFEDHLSHEGVAVISSDPW